MVYSRMPELGSRQEASKFTAAHTTQDLCVLCNEFLKPWVTAIIDKSDFKKSLLSFLNQPNSWWSTAKLRSVPIEWKSNEVIYLEHHTSWESLIESAAQACEFCKWLISLANISPQNVRKSYGRITLMMDGYKASIMDFVVPNEIQLIEFELVNLSQYFCEAEPVELEVPLNALPLALPKRSSIREIAAKAEKMLKCCAESHEKCASKIPDSMPTRVIDVGTHESDQIHLIHTANLPPERYAILSYCWGGEGDDYKLTEDRLEGYCFSIPGSRMPATLADAISFTRLLGIRYLWIDALCILQNKPTDWDNEAPRMGEYYQSAYFCLSALCAPSSESGLFLPRWDLCFQLGTLEGVRIGLKQSLPENDFNLAFRSSPLNSRGWTLQERLLSPRLFHIGEFETFLECRSCLTSERGLVTNREPGTFMSLPKFAKFLAEDKEDPEQLSEETILESWNELIIAYCPRQLKHREDRLMAFDGLRMLYQPRIKCEYFYGLWEADICNGLLWFIGTHGGTVIESSVYDPQSFTLFEVGSSAGSSSGGSYVDAGRIIGSYTLGSSDQPRQFWHSRSLQIQPQLDRPQVHQEDESIKEGLEINFKGSTFKNTSTGNYATPMLLFKVLPTWSWASYTGNINFCVVGNQEIIKYGNQSFLRTKMEVVKLGHTRISGGLRPYIAIRATIAEVELTEGRWISSFQYRLEEKDHRRSIVVGGASNVFLDKERPGSLFTAHGLIMYESGYRNQTADQSVLTLLLVKKVQVEEQDCIDGSAVPVQVFERIGVAFFRYKQMLQINVGRSDFIITETVHLV